MQKSLKQLI